MKVFKWKLDTTVLKEEIKVTDAQLFINLVHAACSTAYKDGMGREFMRRLYKVLNKIEASTEDTVELEDAEFDLIKDLFDRAKWSSHNTKLVCQIYDAIEAVK